MVNNLPIPSWLEVSPSSHVDPPVVTHAQELPFEKLTWKDFERLCLRLVRQEADVEYCQLYGQPGQEQEGIDFFARPKLQAKYRVYQCKRVEEFGPAKVKEAVDLFLAGEWADRSDTFVLCATVNFGNKGLADEVVKQTDRLVAIGKSFLPWDAQQLSLKLKDLPRLVDDFFGRAWVSVYCGDQAALDLGRRLDSESVREFRGKFRLFYRRVFDSHDPGLVLSPDSKSSPLALEERYVLPEISEQRVIEEPPRTNNISSQATRSEMKPMDPADVAAEQLRSSRRLSQSRTYLQRRAVDAWLSQSNRHIILGGPGTGKSSLLRFLTVDLLGEEPCLTLTTQRFRSALPVWVPFALWTRLIANPTTATTSLSEMLLAWLKSWDEERLWPLIERALVDERLLLLVDGLDEWTNESAARIALDRLQVFVSQRSVPAILTSRPHGFMRLGMPEEGWQIGELCSFSNSQQADLADIWFLHRLKNLTPESSAETDEVKRQAHRETETFLAELRQSPDLSELASVPLLLLLLIAFKVHNTRLPQSRFKAYDLLIEHLISTHPKRRKSAALLTEEPAELLEEDIKKALAYLAYYIQQNFPDGLVENHQAIDVIRTFLENQDYGLGISPFDARKHSRWIFDLSEDTLGLLVKRSPQEVGFFHRVFQEYLAAYYLSYMPLEEQLAAVKNYCNDAHWREVVLGLFQITKRGEDIKRFLDVIETSPANPVTRHVRRELLAEVAFGDFNCPVGLARQLAADAFAQIELETWMPYRERVLYLALGGLRSTQVKELVRSRIQHWFPCRSKNRVGILNAMAKWPLIPETIECLWRGIHDADASHQRASARSLADLAKGDRDIGDRIARLAQSVTAPTIQTAAIEALLRGWPQHPDLDGIIEASRKSASPELRLIAILGRIQQQRHTQDDRQHLIYLGSDAADLDYDWRNEVASGLLRGWPQDPVIKANCLRVVQQDSRNWSDIDRSLALYVLLAGYPQDDEVVKFCIKEIADEQFPFLLLQDTAWQLLSRNFRDNTDLIAPLDTWISKQAHADTEISLAALVGRTPTAKAQLFNHLENSTIPHWAAEGLLEGWGMQDPEVSERLTQIALGHSDRASEVAYLLPSIIADKELCRKRLVELLKDPAADRRDFVMYGLVRLGTSQRDIEVADFVLALPPSEWADWRYAGMISALFQGFSWDPRVRELAKRAMGERNAEYGPIAAAYSQDTEIRQLIAQMACPLPAPLRNMIALYLSERHSDTAFRSSVLQHYDLEQDAEIKSQASIGYYSLLVESEVNTQSAVDTLSRDIVCYGPDHDERRQAAFCGLVILKHLDRMLPIQESIGDPRPASISIKDFEPNLALNKLILENWEYIKATFGDELWARLAGRHQQNAEDYLWEHFCLFADEYSSARDDALKYIEEHPERRIGQDALRFLARVRPHSSLLLEYCVNSISREKQERRYSSADPIAIAELLASHFGGNKDVLNRLILEGQQSRGGGLDDYFILALCEGWPERDELQGAYDRICQDSFDDIRRRHWPGPEDVYIRLVCVKAPSSMVVWLLLEVVAKWKPTPRSSSQRVMKPFITRLRTDDDLCEMLLDHLRGTPTGSEKATLPWLLAAAGGVFPGLRSWCIQEVERQLESKIFPEMGLDLSLGSIRPVAYALMDVLELTRVKES